MTFNSPEREIPNGSSPEELTTAFLNAPIPPISEEGLETARMLGKTETETKEWWDKVIHGNRKMLSEEWSTSGFQADLVNAIAPEVSAVIDARTGKLYRKDHLPTFEEYFATRNELERNYITARTGSDNIARFNALVHEFNEAQQAHLEAGDFDGLLNRLRAIFELIKAKKAHF